MHYIHWLLVRDAFAGHDGEHDVWQSVKWPGMAANSMEHGELENVSAGNLRKVRS